MDRLNHVKIVTPEPAAVDAFLHEVLEVPAGWPLPDGAAASPPEPGAAGDGDGFGPGTLTRLRGKVGGGGFITGSPESRQFQIFGSDRAAIWAIAIGTRHVERAWERCQERGIPCTELELFEWNERDQVRAFFCEVGGIVFEVMRVEPRATSSA